MIHGLFKVTDGIYQVRGYDLTAITVVEGQTGWIVIDPGISTTSRASCSNRRTEVGRLNYRPNGPVSCEVPIRRLIVGLDFPKLLSTSF